MSNGHAAVHQPACAIGLWSAAIAATDPFDELNVRAHLEARSDYYELLEDEQFTTMLDLSP